MSESFSCYCDWEGDGHTTLFPELQYYDPLWQLLNDRKTDTPGTSYCLVDFEDLQECPLFDLSISGIRVAPDLDPDFSSHHLPVLNSIHCEPDQTILDQTQLGELKLLLDDLKDAFSTGPSDIGKVPESA